MTLFWDASGPLIRYARGVLHVEDLNPEQKMRWLMGRREMFVTGVRFIAAALGPH